ncbi:hypothetical protein PG996_002092 [Apiospora saccharicola]|uniref:SGNH hydrolase-type esterase domain-containing protein n=1 Tax=Apiospora saccharicola TaxID=335842 RepID=A0ABR1WIH2_9PEZI
MSVLTPLWLIIGLSVNYVIPHNASSPLRTSDEAPEELQIRDFNDPTAFTWVQRFAAIGDSYTAGVSSGSYWGRLWDVDIGGWWCSRYDQSYAVLMKEYVGSEIEDFQSPACFGDQTGKIYDQAVAWKDNVDLLTMTAGGNDLCLLDIIKNCVVLAYDDEATCDAIMTQAQKNLDSIVKDNIKQILKALDTKMAKDGIVVYNSYARFFNEENEDCATEQDWTPFYWARQLIDKDPPLPLTIARRKKFGKLTLALNDAIREVVHEVTDEVKYKIGFANWDLWGIEGVKGQLCDPSSSGRYPDDDHQPDLLFLQARHEKLEDLRAALPPLPERDLDDKGVDRSVYRSSLWNSANPGAETLHALDARNPAPPDCPSDSPATTPSPPSPCRAEVLGLDPQVCAVTDEFKCWQKEGRKGYANPDRPNENYEKFCNDVKSPVDGSVAWRNARLFHEGTPDEHEFVVETSDYASNFNQEECIESMERIINGCDGNDPENPRNWKIGGTWKRGEYRYTVDIKRDSRPWPAKEVDRTCHGWYHVGANAFNIYGAGWSTWDYGQETLLPKTKACLGLGVTAWTFDYFDKPEGNNNMEWKATFKTPVFVTNRCFKNNKVAFGAGGFTHGCEGSSWA